MTKQLLLSILAGVAAFGIVAAGIAIISTHGVILGTLTVALLGWFWLFAVEEASRK